MEWLGALPGLHWDDVATLGPDGWESEHLVARALLRAPMFAELAGFVGWGAVPVLAVPSNYATQLRILVAQPGDGEAIERVLCEIYAIPTSILWDVKCL